MNSNPRIPGHRFLRFPGPAPVPNEVVAATSRQPVGMGDPRLGSVIAACEQDLKRLPQTDPAEVFALHRIQKSV